MTISSESCQKESELPKYLGAFLAVSEQLKEGSSFFFFFNYYLFLAALGLSCGTRAPERMGSVALWHVGSSLTRD